MCTVCVAVISFVVFVLLLMVVMHYSSITIPTILCVFLWFIFSFFLIVGLSVTVKWLAVKTTPEMTYTFSGGALNSTQSNPTILDRCFLHDKTCSICQRSRPFSCILFSVRTGESEFSLCSFELHSHCQIIRWRDNKLAAFLLCDNSKNLAEFLVRN